MHSFNQTNNPTNSKLSNKQHNGNLINFLAIIFLSALARPPSSILREFLSLSHTRAPTHTYTHYFALLPQNNSFYFKILLAPSKKWWKWNKKETQFFLRKATKKEWINKKSKQLLIRFLWQLTQNDDLFIVWKTKTRWIISNVYARGKINKQQQQQRKSKKKKTVN